jgi:hypothetical protein
MAIQIKVKKKIIGKRKRYRSLEEMPDDIRQAIEKAMTHSDPDTQLNSETKMVVNGKEYDNIEEMPPDVRELYDKAVTALRTGKMTPDQAPLTGQGISRGNRHPKAIGYRGPGPIEPQSFSSSFFRWVITGLVFLAAFTGFCLLLHTKILPGLVGLLQPSGGHKVHFYRDADGDGRGNPQEKILGELGEEPPVGYTVVVGDCDDHNPNK